MKSKVRFISYVFCMFLLNILLGSAAEAVIKIMPLGDSITEGSSSGVADETLWVSYRKALYDRLKAAGYVADEEVFVGSLFSGESVADFDPDHEGLSGWTADQIVDGHIRLPSEGKLNEWLIAEEPNIILLHIGTNDVNGGNEDYNEIEDILAVIDDYEATSGKAVWVVLALVIDRSCSPYLPPCFKSWETTDFNQAVENFVFFPRFNFGDRIVLVDMQNDAGIDYHRWTEGGDMWDDLHPFETGYAKMADLWFSGLMDVLPRSNAGPDQNVVGLDTVTLNGSGSMDPKSGDLSYQWVQIGGTAVDLSNYQVVKPTFTAPDVGPAGMTLNFRLTVTDEDGLTSSDKVKIIVELNDICPDDTNKTDPGICGCGIADIDSDGDGTPDCLDNCPADPGKTVPGTCGCGIADADSDGDGTPDCLDNCPADPGKTVPGNCGCGVADIDSDGDGTPDCNDGCDDDPNKIQPAICGCGVADADSDGDGTPDCLDNCPADPGKTVPGNCGCGVADIDSDADGTMDCNEGCDRDPNKTQPAICGCGIADADSDGDGTPDCLDNCPADPGKTDPAICGCGVADFDSDADGTMDCQDKNDGDNDGIPDEEEQGPDGDDPNYDGNGDGTADSMQTNVTSLYTFDNQNYVTIESPAGTSIRNCRPVENPSATNSPSNVSFAYDFFEFTINGVIKGGPAKVILHFPVGTTFNTYFKFGPTSDNSQSHWYEFQYNGQTGAEINDHVVTLHFVDGRDGDDDLVDNGIIIDAGGPGDTMAIGQGGSGINSSSGGGGGGCFISATASGSGGLNVAPVFTWAVLLSSMVMALAVSGLKRCN